MNFALGPLSLWRHIGLVLLVLRILKPVVEIVVRGCATKSYHVDGISRECLRLRVVLLFNYYFTFIDYLGVLEYHLVPIGAEAVAKVLVNLVRLSVLPLDEEGRLGFTWLVLVILLLLLILIEEEPDRSLVPVHSQS